MDKIKWGMIGCGAVTEKKSGPGFYKAEHSSLDAVFSPQLEKAQDYAKRHGIKKVYDSVEDMLKDSEINAIYIATPPKFHKYYAIECMKHGKVPYVEKPLGINKEECEEIAYESRRLNIPVYVAYYRRKMKKFIKIKELINQGAVGEIRSVNVRHNMIPLTTDLNKETLHWTMKAEETQGGRFIDMGTHILDIMDFLIGKVADVSGYADNLGGYYEVEDTVSASLKFENGVLGTGQWCYVAGENIDEMCIIGSEGLISFSVMNYGPVKLKRDNQEKVFEFNEPEHVAQEFIQSIVNELLNKEERQPNLESAVNNVKIIDQILSDYRKKYK